MTPYISPLTANGTLEIGPMISTLCQHQSAQLKLCDTLEALADALPDNVDRQAALHMARMIGPTVRRAHDFEEQELFPALRALRGGEAALDESLERLQFEHWGDEEYADELCEEILAYVMGESPQSHEKLAYMLRGFFESMRRHIAFEREHLMPMMEKMVRPSLH